MAGIIDIETIRYLIENRNLKTQVVETYTIGYKNGRRERVPYEVGEPIAKVMSERAKKEYNGELVTPKGDPLQAVINNGIKIDPAALDSLVQKKDRTS